MLSLQTRSIQSRFLQSRNLNCIALCEGAGPCGVVGRWGWVCWCDVPIGDSPHMAPLPSAVITSKDLQKHGNIWVCPVSDHVCTRFFFV